MAAGGSTSAWREPASRKTVSPSSKSLFSPTATPLYVDNGATGWPYIQHRGGPEGFLKVIDNRTLAFADFRGNKQYISTGNLLSDDSVALIFVDYTRQARLKILGRAKIF